MADHVLVIGSARPAFDRVLGPGTDTNCPARSRLPGHLAAQHRCIVNLDEVVANNARLAGPIEF